MITALVLASLTGLLLLSLPRGPRRAPEPGPPADAPRPCAYPESMTAELEPWEEEYLAFLADDLWPDDEYLDLEHRIDHEGDGEGGTGR
ncbi:hypothetical protein GCM10023085_47360 [Actinomadura viridis]